MAIQHNLLLPPSVIKHELFHVPLRIETLRQTITYIQFFLYTVSKTPHTGAMFLDVKNQTLTFKSTHRRSDNPNRKSEEKKISIKGTFFSIHGYSKKTKRIPCGQSE